ncbi:MAG: glycosyltransferase family 39 protein [bacterium]
MSGFGPIARSAVPLRPPRNDRTTALILGIGTFALLFFTSVDVGVARDEGIYVNAAETYLRYVKEVEEHPKRRWDKKTIARYYQTNAEHPPGTKHLYGLSWKYLHRCNCHHTTPRLKPGNAPHDKTWGVVDDITAFRLPAMLATALLVAFIYLFGAAAFGQFAGFLAAVAYIVIPRVFFHSHLAGLDAPITAAMFITVYAYYRALHSWRWTIATGLIFGLALLTKFNAFFLPLILLVHYGWASRKEFRHPLLATVGLASLLPLVFLSIAALIAGKGRGWINVGGLALLGLFLLRRGSFAWPLCWKNLVTPGLLVLTACAGLLRQPLLAGGVGLLAVGAVIWRWQAFQRPLRAVKLLAPAVFFSMLILGGVVLFAQWPWLWHDTTARFNGYLSYHLEHTFYNTEYFGKNYNLPPFPVAYPLLMTLVTLPLPTLLAALGGLALALRGPLSALTRWRPGRGTTEPVQDDPRRGWGRPLLGRDHAPAFLVSLNALFPIALIALPSTPIFGGARLWMPAWPYLALLAGWAVQELYRSSVPLLDSLIWRRSLAVGLLTVLVIPPLVQTARAGDIAPSWYTPAVGGPPGAADLGLKRQYWGYATRRLLPTLNDLARPKLKHYTARVPTYFHDTNHYSRDLYARSGLLLPNITYAGDGYSGISRSQLAIYLHEKHQVMWEHLIWQSYGTVQPDRVLTLDGVPLITVYQRRGRIHPRPPFFQEPPGFRANQRRAQRR